MLTSDAEGWVFSKKEVKANIAGDKWRLREKDGNYKINTPLPDQNSFYRLCTWLRLREFATRC